MPMISAETINKSGTHHFKAFQETGDRGTILTLLTAVLKRPVS